MKRTIACTFALVCFCAFGANVYWSNTGTGGWETTSNWQGDALPGVADTAINNVGGTVLFTDGMEQTVKFFHTGTESGKSGHLQITGGKLTLVAVASQIGSVAGGGGTVEMTGSSCTWASFRWERAVQARWFSPAASCAVRTGAVSAVTPAAWARSPSRAAACGNARG